MKKYEIDELLDLVTDKGVEIAIEYGFGVNSKENEALVKLRDYMFTLLYGEEEYTKALKKAIAKLLAEMFVEVLSEDEKRKD